MHTISQKLLKQLWPIQPALQEHRPSVCLTIWRTGQRTRALCTKKLRLASCNNSISIQLIYSLKKYEFRIIRYHFKKDFHYILQFFKNLRVVTMSSNILVLTTSKIRYNSLTWSHGSLFLQIPIFCYLHSNPKCP